MTDENKKPIPREESRAGYDRGKQEVDTPVEKQSGVWQRKTRSRYPGEKAGRGMAEENKKPIPRREQRGRKRERIQAHFTKW